VVSGPGGVGKGTVVRRLAEMDPQLWVSRSWTTRPQRPGESDDAYTFVDRERFQKRVNAGGFLEWNKLSSNGHLYGTPTLEPPPGADLLLEIEPNGARQVKKAHPEAVVVLIVAPSIDEQRARMRRRGDDEASIDGRIALGLQELEQARPLADAVVVNDEVQRAAGEVAGILAAARRQGRR
jgi:guanylate kinase